VTRLWMRFVEGEMGRLQSLELFRTIAELNEAEGASKSGSANRGSAPLTNLLWLSNQPHVIRICCAVVGVVGIVIGCTISIALLADPSPKTPES